MPTFRRDPVTGMALPPRPMPSNPGGRPKGSINKISKTMKEAFKEAFELMGGVPKLVEWAEENPDKFYPLVARLLPVDITSNDEAITPTIVKVNLIAPNATTKADPERIEGIVYPAVHGESDDEQGFPGEQAEIRRLPSAVE